MLRKLSREEFNRIPKWLLREDREGSGAMAMNATDYYATENGGTIRHDWGMGGESFCYVESMPVSNGLVRPV